jgi:hypothetical protein
MVSKFEESSRTTSCVGSIFYSKSQQKTECIQEQMGANFLKNDGSFWIAYSNHIEDITNDIVCESYEIATALLKSLFECIFLNKQEGATDLYTTGTWSFKIKMSEVQKHGTDNDKATLPPSTTSNKQHKTKHIITPRKCQRLTNIAKREGEGRVH